MNEHDEDPGYPYNLPDCPRCSGKHDPYDGCFE